MSRRITLALLALLALGTFWAAIALVSIRFEARALHAKLEKAGAEGRDLRRENRRLQIELTTFADLRDIYAHGTERFSMKFPSISERTMILLPDGK